MGVHKLRRQASKLLVVMAMLLVISSGAAIADENHGTTTAETTSEHSDGHHAGEGGEETSHNDDGSSLGWVKSIVGLVALAAVPTAPAYWFGKQRDRLLDFGGGELTAIGLILVSAAVHLYLFVQHSELKMLLAGLGFVGAVVLFFLGVNRRLLYALGIPYVAAQIALWWESGMPHLQSFGLLDKVAQILLIGVLSYLLWADLESTSDV
ncbi:hypothetical protein [Halorussus halophilus]|uniref:hypothetical protein n=1 Tax=Halorussus halophilus TaxID=2650975 RepID=UPI0013017A22|nr:hypothetical protein [Halorussus halophilus]